MAERYGTPLLVVSTEEVVRNYTFLQKHLPKVKLYYAVKANPEPSIVRTLARLGACFDVASDGEMAYLRGMGITGDRMIYANPIKTMRGLAMARETKIQTMTFDNKSEIDKMASAMAGASVLLRVRVDNPRALVDLNKKFGAHPRDAMSLLRAARKAGLDVAGLCFHVGSQSTDAAAYLSAIRICRSLWDEARAEGFDMRILDIGGEILVISQFTLCADIKKGNRPSFTDSAPPAEANRLYEYFCEKLLENGVRKVEKGVFAADMKVEIENDGPVTIVMDTDIWDKR